MIKEGISSKLSKHVSRDDELLLRASDRVIDARLSRCIDKESSLSINM